MKSAYSFHRGLIIQHGCAFSYGGWQARARAALAFGARGPTPVLVSDRGTLHCHSDAPVRSRLSFTTTNAWITANYLAAVRYAQSIAARPIVMILEGNAFAPDELPWEMWLIEDPEIRAVCQQAFREASVT